MPAKNKRRFGRVRELPSGRWQARYNGPDGIDRPAPHTFESKTSAERWLTVTEADVLKGDWTDPDAGRVLFGQYARDWIAERPALRFKTIKLYRYLLRRHLGPAFEARALADIKEPNVRRWRKDLRWGELAALRRRDVDAQARTINVTRQLSEQPGGGFAFGPPKSEAGVRTVAIPEVIMPDLALHIMTHAAPGDDGLLFTSPGVGPLRHTNFRRRVWLPALQKAGLPPIHFHDLRHTGNTLSANAGANLRELMDRMGHSSPRAALIYLHGSDERQHAIAAALSRRATAELKEAQHSGALKQAATGPAVGTAYAERPEQSGGKPIRSAGRAASEHRKRRGRRVSAVPSSSPAGPVPPR
jgi:integrase